MSSTIHDERSPLLAKSIDDPESGSGSGSISPPLSTPTETNPTSDVDPAGKARLGLIMPALMVGVFLAALDNTIVVASYARIGSEFHALNEANLIVTSYMLTVTAFQPLYGRFSDIFGRKVALLTSYTIFGVGCLLCGLARNLPELVAARAFAGVGGGGMTIVTSVLLSDLVSIKARGTFQGIVNIVFATGAGLGAPIGGWLADGIGWRMAFLGQAPVTVIAFLGVYFTLKTHPMHLQEPRSAKLKRVDFAGAATLVVAISFFVVAFDVGGNVLPWTHPLVLTAIPLSIALFVAFGYVEAKKAREPIAPLHVVTARTPLAALICNFCAFMSYFGMIYNVPLYFQLLGESASKSGTRLLPSIIAGSAGSLLGGFFMHLTGSYYWITVISYTLLAIGQGSLVLWNGHNPFWQYTMSLVPIGLGNGIRVTTTLIAIIHNVSKADQATATGLSYLFRATGTVLGVSLSSSILQNYLKTRLPRVIVGPGAPEIIEKVRQSVTYIADLPAEMKGVVVGVYLAAIRICFFCTMFVAAGAAASALFIREKKLHN